MHTENMGEANRGITLTCIAVFQTAGGRCAGKTFAIDPKIHYGTELIKEIGMKQKRAGVERRKTLRTNAEALVADVAPKATTTMPADLLMHELLVHKVQLELQSEELRQAYAALEDARKRYVDIYELGPLGYITVNLEGVVSETNMMGAAMLGMDRPELIGCLFSQLVAAQDRERWHRIFLSMKEHVGTVKKTFYLEMIGIDKSIFHAHLDCLRREPMHALPELLLVLVDVSKLSVR